MQRDRVLKSVLKESFIVSTKSGEALEGLLLDADEKTIRLGNVFRHNTATKIGIDGEIFIPREQILYMQRP